jgi:hypothetical protein
VIARTPEESEWLLRALGDSGDVVAFRLDASARITEWNRGFQKALDLTSDPSGQPLERFLDSGAPGPVTFPREGDDAAIRLHFRSEDGTLSTFNGRARGVAQGHIVAGARWLITHSDVLQKMTSLENQLLQVNRELQSKVRELEEARETVRTLSDLLPICSSCKKIRDDQGYWSAIETYITNHSQILFSHGICPDCMRRLYPEFAPPE